jgi:hypothetical protein
MNYFDDVREDNVLYHSRRCDKSHDIVITAKQQTSAPVPLVASSSNAHTHTPTHEHPHTHANLTAPVVTLPSRSSPGIGSPTKIPPAVPQPVSLSLSLSLRMYVCAYLIYVCGSFRWLGCVSRAIPSIFSSSFAVNVVMDLMLPCLKCVS